MEKGSALELRTVRGMQRAGPEEALTLGGVLYRKCPHVEACQPQYCSGQLHGKER